MNAPNAVVWRTHSYLWFGVRHLLRSPEGVVTVLRTPIRCVPYSRSKYNPKQCAKEGKR